MHPSSSVKYTASDYLSTCYLLHCSTAWTSSSCIYTDQWIFHLWHVLWVWGLSLVSSYFPLKMETANISETLQNQPLFSHNMVQLLNEQKMDDCYLRGLVDASEEHDAPIFMVGRCGFFENVPTFYQTTWHHIPVGRNLHSGYMREPQTSQTFFPHMHAHIHTISLSSSSDSS